MCNFHARTPELVGAATVANHSVSVLDGMLPLVRSDRVCSWLSRHRFVQKSSGSVSNKLVLQDYTALAARQGTTSSSLT